MLMNLRHFMQVNRIFVAIIRNFCSQKLAAQTECTPQKYLK